ncbi:MAG: hypothetical protein HS113_26975 [Verrucomicrobiales bacterium]|nr:hypothetical protein [Verrucomicrobiales bacterium]
MEQRRTKGVRARRRHRHKRRTRAHRLRHWRANLLAWAAGLLGLALFHGAFIVGPLAVLPGSELGWLHGWLLGCGVAGVLCGFVGWSLWKWESAFLEGLEAAWQQVLGLGRGSPMGTGRIAG